MYVRVPETAEGARRSNPTTYAQRLPLFPSPFRPPAASRFLFFPPLFTHLTTYHWHNHIRGYTRRAALHVLRPRGRGLGRLLREEAREFLGENTGAASRLCPSFSVPFPPPFRVICTAFESPQRGLHSRVGTL